MVALLAFWGAAPHSGTGLVTVVASLGRGREGRRGGREGKVEKEWRRMGGSEKVGGKWGEEGRRGRAGRMRGE